MYLASPQPHSYDSLPFFDWIANKIAQRIKRKAHKNVLDMFLPTSLYQMLSRMKQNVPKAHLIISDFDSLVTPIEGIQAPIVSKKGLKSADKKDYNTYLVDRG